MLDTQPDEAHKDAEDARLFRAIVLELAQPRNAILLMQAAKALPQPLMVRLMDRVGEMRREQARIAASGVR
jgi:hypothetical protein